MNTQISPGKGMSNSTIEFDLVNQEHSDNLGTLKIIVSSKLDSTTSTTISIQDVCEKDLRDMAKIFNALADLYK